VKNIILAEEFDRFAKVLDFRGNKEDFFRLRALRRGMQIIRNLPEPIENYSYDDLIAISGIGKGMADKIVEFNQKGFVEEFEQEYRNTPPGIFDLFGLSLLGAKKIRLLNKALGVTDIPELKKAIESGEVEKLRGFGKKSAEKLLWSIGMQKILVQKKCRGTIYGIAMRMVKSLEAQDFVKRASVAGSMRRGKEEVHDLDLLASGDEPLEIIDFFCSNSDITEVLAKGETKATVILNDYLQVDLRVVSDEIWGSALQHFTGSKEHNVMLRSMAKRQGLKISEWGVFDGERRIGAKTEEEVYQAVGLGFIPHEIREGVLEFSREVPDLLESSDVRGDLHLHSTYSDGLSSIEEMVKKALSLNYEYMAITDHSSLIPIANGLDESRLDEQREEILILQKKYPQIRILYGTECDILEDGSLVYSDDVLRRFDFVVASIHRNMNEKPTERTLRAIESPYVNLIAHPTGQRESEKAPMEIDFEKIFKKCVETGTALEVNASPYRIDLRSNVAIEAVERGVKLALNTDAHITNDMDNIHLAVTCARRSWCTKKEVINAWSLEELMDFVERKRRG
jgi:DNA polymerase (family 10)